MTWPVPFEAVTSHRIVVLAPGVLRKDLSAAGLLGDARAAKPAFLHDPTREPAAYRSLLGPLGMEPCCLDSGTDWVILKEIRGLELWQIGEFDVWVAAARALATVHGRLASGDTRGVPLVVHDENLARTWRERAAAAGAPPAVLAAHERASARLNTLPRTVIHGEAYPSNVIVGAGRAPKISFVDWETVGVGPAVLDVAALTAGSWSAAAVEAMSRAYFDAATCRAGAARSWRSWKADLTAARLYLCVQWLGWSAGWRPPAAHAHDWLREANLLAEVL